MQSTTLEYLTSPGDKVLFHRQILGNKCIWDNTIKISPFDISEWNNRLDNY